MGYFQGELLFLYAEADAIITATCSNTSTDGLIFNYGQARNIFALSQFIESNPFLYPTIRTRRTKIQKFMKNLIRNESAIAIFIRAGHLFLSLRTKRISSIRNRFLALIICLGTCSSGMGQWLSDAKWETGIATGPMVFMGDLGGNPGVGKPLLKDYNIPSTRYMIGAYITCYPQPWLGVRFMINHGELYGSDALTNAKSGEALSRKNRNLDFKSQLNEGLLMAEFMPTVFLEDQPGQYIGKIRPYGLLGIGVFHFNPQGSYTDSLGNTSWQYLRPLHTEGEGFADIPDEKCIR